MWFASTTVTLESNWDQAMSDKNDVLRRAKRVSGPGNDQSRT
jgi:hypothetical protein